MQTHIATGAHTYRASTAVPAGFRARLGSWDWSQPILAGSK